MDEASDEENTKAHPFKKLQEKLELYLMELPVLGFNSGKYNINAAKNPFFAHLVKHEQVQFLIKRNNNHMCLKTTHLKFLDITNYTRKNAQVVTNLQQTCSNSASTSCQQDVFARVVPSLLQQTCSDLLTIL